MMSPTTPPGPGSAEGNGIEGGRRYPVFVVGCPRSGTTLLYHMLVSSGTFANYRAETHLFDMWAPKFGSLRSRRSRARFFQAWVRTPFFERTGLPAEPLRRRLERECRGPGDILRTVMDAIAAGQGAERWAECTPAHLLYMRAIKRTLHSARFIHVIRDGRDVALSLARLGWVHPLPWDRSEELQVAGWAWEWLVERGRRIGRTLGTDYAEILFEDLVLRPRLTLQNLSQFVGCRLDYDAIVAEGVGSVGQPNTAFPEEANGRFQPVGRWREEIPAAPLRAVEATIGRTLDHLGYELSAETAAFDVPFGLRARRRAYRGYRGSRQWLKDHTALSRLLVRAGWSG